MKSLVLSNDSFYVERLWGYDLLRCAAYRDCVSFLSYHRTVTIRLLLRMSDILVDSIAHYNLITLPINRLILESVKHSDLVTAWNTLIIWNSSFFLTIIYCAFISPLHLITENGFLSWMSLSNLFTQYIFYLDRFWNSESLLKVVQNFNKRVFQQVSNTEPKSKIIPLNVCGNLSKSQFF